MTRRMRGTFEMGPLDGRRPTRDADPGIGPSALRANTTEARPGSGNVEFVQAFPPGPSYFTMVEAGTGRTLLYRYAYDADRQPGLSTGGGDGNEPEDLHAYQSAAQSETLTPAETAEYGRAADRLRRGGAHDSSREAYRTIATIDARRQRRQAVVDNRALNDANRRRYGLAPRVA
jgi:hypothetical protein